MQRDPQHRRSLTEDLEALLVTANGQAMTVRDAITALNDRGMAFGMLLLTLPFLIPVPLVGLSTPIGAAIALYGLRLMLRQPPWLPRFLGGRTLSYKMLERLIGVASRWGKRVEKLLKPRLNFMLWPAVDVPIGLSLAFCGFFLALPLPIPFTNAIPAVAIVLLLLGLIERDGVFVILGELLSLAILGLSVYVCWLFYRYGMEKGWAMLHHFWTSAATTQPTSMGS